MEGEDDIQVKIFNPGKVSAWRSELGRPLMSYDILCPVHGTIHGALRLISESPRYNRHSLLIAGEKKYSKYMLMFLLYVQLVCNTISNSASCTIVEFLSF